jgi:hypothetical protein
METVEIRVVKNGFWCCDPACTHSNTISPQNIHVFESFEALTKWLQETLKQPKKSS